MLERMTELVIEVLLLRARTIAEIAYITLRIDNIQVKPSSLVTVFPQAAYFSAYSFYFKAVLVFDTGIAVFSNLSKARREKGQRRITTRAGRRNYEAGGFWNDGARIPPGASLLIFIGSNDRIDGAGCALFAGLRQVRSDPGSSPCATQPRSPLQTPPSSRHMRRLPRLHAAGSSNRTQGRHACRSI